MKKNKPVDLPTLRKKAEKKLRDKKEKLVNISAEDVQPIIHELQVHQIELEMQNEELRTAQIDLERSRNKYTDLYDFAPVGYFTFDKDGLILDVNLTGAALLRKERSRLIRTPFPLFIDKNYKDIFHKHCRSVLESKGLSTCEIMLGSKSSSQIHVRLTSIPVEESEDTFGHIRTSVSDITEQKQAEKTLEDMQRFSRKIADATPDILYIFDVNDHNLVYVNSALEKTLGYSQKYIQEMGESLYINLIHPEDLLQINDARKNSPLKNDDDVFELDFRIKHSSGEWRWLSSRNIIFSRTDDGSPKEVLGVAHDITKRKQSENDLTESGERLALAISGTRIGMFDWNMLTGEILWTDQLEATMGYTTTTTTTTTTTAAAIKPHTYKDWADRVHPEDMPDINEHIQRCMAEHAPYELEYRIIWPDGSIHWVAGRGVFQYNEQGHAVRSIGIVIDVTGRKKAEEALRQAETQIREQYEELEQIYHNAPVGLCLLDIDLRFIRINDRLAEINGLPAADHLGKSIAKIVPSLLPAVREVTGRILATGQAVTGYEFSGETPLQPGVTRYWDEKWYPIRDTAGAITGFGVIVEEITERRKSEEERERLIRELERSNKELDQFAYIASHDLQEPLRMVSSYVKLLSDRYKGKLDKDADEFIDYAVNGANHMKSLLNDLLAYSRVGTHGNPFDLTDLNASVKTAIANLRKIIEKSKALIKHKALPLVYADNVQMVQVFQNLIENAIKFCGSKPPEIRISSDRKETEWVISVKDNCMGIDPKYSEKIFIMFKRLQPSAHPGTGIGLAICKKVMERHGGRIWVESEPGKGATFYFTIPVKE